MAMSITGQRGNSREPTNRTSNSTAASVSVATLSPPSPVTNDASWAGTVSPSTSTPVTLPSWLPIMLTATPAR